MATDDTLSPGLSIRTLYLSKAELAAELDTSTRTLDRLEAQRIGPPRVKVGNIILYPRAGVMAWLEARTREPTRVIHPRASRSTTPAAA